MMKNVKLNQLATQLHFKKLTAEGLKEMGSFNLVDGDENFIAIICVPVNEFRRRQIDSICHAMNNAMGK